MNDQPTDNQPIGCHVTSGEYYRKEAEQYAEAKKVAFRDRIELYNTLKIVGDLTGKRVIDVACGTGWLTRELSRQLNPSYVMGTDLSRDMIELAEKENNVHSDIAHIDYVVEDARDTTCGSRDFDVVVSNWLLVYAHDKQELARYCQGLASKAKPGARLVTLVVQPEAFSTKMVDLKKYGLEFIQPPRVCEGAKIVWRLFTPSGDFALEIENFYFSRRALTEALEQAGFGEVKFIDCKDLALEPVVDLGQDDVAYWQDFFHSPVLMMITGRRVD